MPENGSWTLITHHGAVLVYLAANPGATIRGVSDAIGITERHVSRIIKDLDKGGYIDIHKDDGGRRNSYSVNMDAKMRHPVFQEVPVSRIIRVLSVLIRDK